MSQQENTGQNLVIQKETNGSAVTALILGIIGVVVGFVPYIGWFMAPVWLLAFIFGVVGMRKKYKRGMAFTGFLLGILGAVYKIGFWVVAAGGFMAALSGISDTTSKVDEYSESEVVSTVDSEVEDSNDSKIEKTSEREKENTSDREIKDSNSEEIDDVNKASQNDKFQQQKYTTIPSVVGEDIESAKLKLKENRVRIANIVGVEDESIRKGEVIRIVPGEGEQVEKGSEVVVYQSAGGPAQTLILQDMFTGEEVEIIQGRNDQIFFFIYFNYYDYYLDKRHLMDEMSDNINLLKDAGIEVIGIISEDTLYKDKKLIESRNWQIPVYLNTDEQGYPASRDLSVEYGSGEVILHEDDFDGLAQEEYISEILDKIKIN